jgi:hypothetical protein
LTPRKTRVFWLSKSALSNFVRFAILGLDLWSIASDTGDKNKDTRSGASASAYKVGKLSDGLLRLVEEIDGKGNICYCVETVDDDSLVYSSLSKAQAFSFCEGYRAAEGKDISKSRKPKENDDNNYGDQSATRPAIDPAKTKRKRMVF